MKIPQVITNITYDELAIGQQAQLNRTLTEKDIAIFGYMTGDINPVHFNKEYAKNTQFKDIIAHGMWSGSLISNILGTKLPGPGTIYLNQTFRFSHPIYIGDQITLTLTVLEKKPKNRVLIDCICTNQNNEVVTSGIAEVIAPTEKITTEAIDPNELVIN